MLFLPYLKKNYFSHINQNQNQWEFEWAAPQNIFKNILKSSKVSEI